MWQALEYHAMRLISSSPLLLRVLGHTTVARSAYYPKPMFWREQRPALAERIKVVDRQVRRLAADLAPRTLAADLCAELLPGWVKVGVRLAFFPPAHCSCAVRRASVAHRGEHAAVKTRTLEGHAFGKSGSGMDGAMIRAS